jgi:predicted tellurium resistance membrane protein TerC
MGRWQRILLGAALLVVGGGIAVSSFIGPAKPFREWLQSLGTFATSATALVLFVAFVIVTAAGVHLLVRPFEMALDEGAPEGSAAS